MAVSSMYGIPQIISLKWRALCGPRVYIVTVFQICGFPHLSERVVLMPRYFCFCFFFSYFINVAVVLKTVLLNTLNFSTKDTSQFFLKQLSHFLLIWKRAMVFKRKNNWIPEEKKITHFTFLDILTNSIEPYTLQIYYL